MPLQVVLEAVRRDYSFYLLHRKMQTQRHAATCPGTQSHSGVALGPDSGSVWLESLDALW